MIMSQSPIDVVDAPIPAGLWMMHVCIFHTLDNPQALIYGFDVIAGKNKMTGAFPMTFRSSIPIKSMIQGYYESVEHFVSKSP